MSSGERSVAQTDRGRAVIGLPPVAAVVVTRNRRDVAVECVMRLCAASVAPRYVVVVDNASTDGTAAALRALGAEVDVLRSPENLGPAGGFALGMAKACRLSCDWVALLNDDCFVEHDTLKRLLSVCVQAEPQVAMVAPVVRHGGREVYGYLWRRVAVPLYSPVASPQSTVVDVDMVTFNGVLVRTTMICRLGVPRADFFMMWEEWEYCLRARRAGYRVVVALNARADHRTLGSTARTTPVWRNYYQARNHLRWALEDGNVADVIAWGGRQLKLSVASLLRREAAVAGLWWRLRGAVDAVRGRMGPVVVPAAGQ